MAAGPAIEMWSREDGEAASDDSIRRTYRRTRAFTVTLAADDALEVAFSSAGLPFVGQSLPSVPLALCRRLRPSRVSPIMAIVVAEYQGEVGPNGVEGSSPVDNPIVVSWSANIADEAIDEDRYGVPIVTANNEPIDGLTERVPDLVCTVQRNFLDINTFGFFQFLRSVNSDVFEAPGGGLWPAGTVRFMDFQASRVFASSQATAFWQATGTFHCRYPYNTTADKAWWKRVRHEGFKIRKTAGGPIIHGRDGEDGDGELLSRPVLLKSDGTVEPDKESAHFLEFETVFPLAYSQLGFL